MVDKSGVAACCSSWTFYQLLKAVSRTKLSIFLMSGKMSLLNWLQSFAKKTSEKLRKFKKSCNHKQNINGICNEKLHNICLEPFAAGVAMVPTQEKKNTYEIRKIRIKKMKSSNYSLVPSPPAKNKIYSDLVENSQKATLNFHFNPRFLLKPSKFQIYFAKDCKFIRFIKIYFSLKSTFILKSSGM